MIVIRRGKDHYRGWPSVLARLSKLSVTECRMRLERAWRVKAPPALSRRLDESRMGWSLARSRLAVIAVAK